MLRSVPILALLLAAMPAHAQGIGKTRGVVEQYLVEKGVLNADGTRASVTINTTAPLTGGGTGSTFTLGINTTVNTDSMQFGSGSTTAARKSLALGVGAVIGANGDESILITSEGTRLTGAGLYDKSIVINSGNLISVSNIHECVAIGWLAIPNCAYTVAIGPNLLPSHNWEVLVGGGVSSADFADVIAIGAHVRATSAHEIIIGGENNTVGEAPFYSDHLLFNGKIANPPALFTIRGSDSNTNGVAGTGLILAGGRPNQSSDAGGVVGIDVVRASATTPTRSQTWFTDGTTWLMNGTSPTGVRLYNTTDSTTSPTNAEWLEIVYDAGQADGGGWVIRPGYSGTGQLRSMKLGNNNGFNAAYINFKSNNNVDIHGDHVGCPIPFAFDRGGFICYYDGNVLQGFGTPVTRASGAYTGKSALQASIAEVTTLAALYPHQYWSTFQVSAHVNIKTAGSSSLNLRVDYVDTDGVSRTQIIPMTASDGTTTASALTATGHYSGQVIIRAKDYNGGSIVLKEVGTSPTLHDVDGVILQIQGAY